MSKEAIHIPGYGTFYLDTLEQPVERGVFETYEERSKRKAYFDQKTQNELKRDERNEQYDKIESKFIWQYFAESETLFPDLVVTDITKLIMVATYCEYNSNRLVMNGRNMTKDNVARVLNLTRTPFNAWFDKMVNLGYLIIQDGYVRLNKRWFGSGRISSHGAATRVFVDVYRDLYNNVPVRDHSKIGHIMRLIPYLNPYFNVLCKTPSEKDPTKLERFRMSDVAEILGVSKKNIRRLANDLLSITYGDSKTPLVGLVAFRSLDVGNMFIIINSKLLFGGNYQEYMQTEQLFNTRLGENNKLIEDLFTS